MLIISVLKSSIRDAPIEKQEQLKRGYYIFMKHVVGLIITAITILTNNMRGEKDLSMLYNRGVLNKEDYQYFQSLNAVPVHALIKLSDLIHESYRKGLFDNIHGTNQTNMTMIHNALLGLRRGLGGVSLNIDVQVAYPFIQ
jgi:hypothetical protein